ncbi:MAG: hypothetical protein U0361_04925 [Nitrospiraceae bacterium]
MKVVLDIETVQAPREEWAWLVGGSLLGGSRPLRTAEGTLFAVGEAQEQQRVEDELYEKSSSSTAPSAASSASDCSSFRHLEPRGATSLVWRQ